jgi:NADPH-dependent 2,4-dienoyl-CoA reductase/sulfur reductase-like enzyme/rhodanese-related sulfurtransferase
MGDRILIIGGVAGGASAAARIRRLDESADITVFEKGPDVSFSNCSLPYYLSRLVKDSEKLVMMRPEQFKKQYNIDVRTESEVVSIDRENHNVHVKPATGAEYDEHYDKLVLSPGSAPIMPRSIAGIDSGNVFGIRNVVDIRRLDEYIHKNSRTNIAIVGGGFIGCEIAENLVAAGLSVSLIEAADQILTTLDFDLVQILHKEMMDHGVHLVLSDGLKAIDDKKVVLCSGREVPADAVVMAVGVRPETTLAKNAGLEIGATGAIKVNQHFQTSDPCIYAVGDAVEVYNRLTHSYTKLALAWPAQMEARYAADHICNQYDSNFGVIGSSVVKVFDLTAASTGLNEKSAKKAGIPYDFAYVIPQDKVGIVPNSKPLHLKVLFEIPTGRIIGAQAVGANNADRRIDVIATVISMNGTLENLKDLELCYAPVTSTAKDAVNMAGLVGMNLLNGVFRQVPVSEVRNLVENNAYIVDVREKKEFELGHIINAHNIPLSEIRNRIDEIPHDVPVYLHCRSSQRSYNALMALKNLGFQNVINISGSYLGLSYYEYAQDVLNNRKPILTEYNFR